EDNIQVFKRIHPYAFYCLDGGDYDIADIKIPVLGIDITKFKLDKSSPLQYQTRLRKSEDQCTTGIDRLDFHGKLLGEYITCRLVELPVKSGHFIVRCLKAGSGSYASVNRLLVRKRQIPYHVGGKIGTADVLFCDGNLRNSVTSDVKIKQILKQTGKMPSAVERPETIIDLQNIHPYAFYLLSRGSDELNSPLKGIIEVNAAKFKLDVKSNEVFGKRPYRKAECIGFTYSGLSQEESFLAKDDFYFTIYRRLADNFYIIKSVFRRANEAQQTDYILIKRYCKYYYDFPDTTVLQVLRRCGEFGANPPTEKDIELIKKNLSEF
ncbi:MAG: hypothetical protein WC082_08915, partial [Victivallales bacterium]